MRKNYLWYNFFRFGIARAGLYLFYSNIEVIGLKKIPRNKPYIITPNHQNALIDALLVSSHIPGYSYFLTRSGVFSTPLMNWFCRSINLLPVYRARDGLSSVTKNNEVFEFCVDSLKKNYPIVVFPEANHDLRRRIRPLSKGFTRIAFNAEVKYNWELDLQIIPVGLNYSEHRRLRNRMKIIIGDPVPISKYKEIFKSNERAASNALKSDVSDEMKKIIMHVPNLDKYPAMQVILTDLENDVNEYLYPDKVNEKINKISPLLSDELIEVGKQVVEISNKFDISIKTINGRKTPWVYVFLFFPLYVFSWFNNIIPYQAVRRIIKTKIKDPTFDATIKYLLGITLFPLFWGLISIILWAAGVKGVYILAYFALSVLTSVNFKNANSIFSEAATKRKLDDLKANHPDLYKTFTEGIDTLNEFRKKVL